MKKDLAKLLAARKRRDKRKESPSVIRIKTPEQVEGIRASCRLAAATLEYLAPLIVPGMTTQDIDDLASRFIQDHGASAAPLGYRGYPKSICTSLNEVICHGIPSSSVVLKEGDILNVDVTTILNGYYGDTSRMFVIGEISDDARSLLGIARESLNVGIRQVFPGNRFGNIGYAIHQYASKNGYSVVHQFCGHGTGVEFHEEPQVNHIAPQDTGPVMSPGMVFTIEPMINVGSPLAEIDSHDRWTARTEDGSLSAQYEHTVLVTPDGCEVLTQSSW